MPRLQERRAPFDHDAFDLAELVSRESLQRRCRLALAAPVESDSRFAVGRDQDFVNREFKP